MGHPPFKEADFIDILHEPHEMQIKAVISADIGDIRRGIPHADLHAVDRTDRLHVLRRQSERALHLDIHEFLRIKIGIRRKVHIALRRTDPR